LDEKALLACMAYVDLNPLRAKIAETPEESDHTSIKKRIASFQDNQPQPSPLSSFIGSLPQDKHQGIPFELTDYLSLVDWTGRDIRTDKRGYIKQDLPPILTRLGIPEDKWLQLTSQFERKTRGLTGSYIKTKWAAELLGYQRVPRTAQNKRYFQ